MHRQSLLPILRQSGQTRTAATAARIKINDDSATRQPLPSKWTSQPDKTIPTAKTWARPSIPTQREKPTHSDGRSSVSGGQQPLRQIRVGSMKRPQSSSRRESPLHRETPPHRELPSKGWSPTSLPTKRYQGSEQRSSRRSDGQDLTQLLKTDMRKLDSLNASQNRLQEKQQAVSEDVTKAADVTRETVVTEDPQSYTYRPELDETQDERWESEKTLRTSRLRASAYKTRGSVVRNLHDNEGHQRSQPETRRNTQAQSPKIHLPRLKEKPRIDVYIPSTVTVGRLAKILDVKLNRLVRKMIEAGMGEEASHDHVLTSDYAVLLAEELRRNPIVDDEAAFDLYPPTSRPDSSCPTFRPPIVTIMGHVDHGKTTLLDTLRSSAVAKGEAGGITQHIGAFSVPVKSSQGQHHITFLDTPGHAAFSAMRERGANATDIVVLVVAADDGIMPQTKEVINLLRKDMSKVGLVVAINKVDKPEADVEAVKLALMAEGIQLESFGGDVPFVEVSGLTGKGLPDLVETLAAMAEVQDLRAEKEGPVHGYVLESKVTKGLGPVATVLVLRGSLKTGSHALSGTHMAKVRLMTDSNGKNVKVATPGMAVTVSGWKSLPKAGDEVLDGKESEVKKALANRERMAAIAASLADVDAINAVRKEERERRKAEANNADDPVPSTAEADGPKELKLIIKADVSGSAEAIEGALQGIGNKKAMTKIVSAKVGDVTDSDVLMAKAVNATIVAFSVSVPRSVENMAVQNAVPITTSPIIYHLMEDVRKRVAALLPTITETTVTGEATVLQLFDIHLKAKEVKKIAGCRVVNGIIEKVRFARIVRDGSVIHEGSLDTMRVLKKDVTEVRKGSECGLSLVNFGDIREGDLIQMYQTIEKPGVL